ncbi:MAG: dipeptide epimerase [Candidatus Glassbacteria bacterium]|nr:dipeptide epimerase [Candidatus Glassbacteria bacterium]
MRISYEPMELRASHSLDIAHEGFSGNVFHNVLVRIEYEGIIGLGEAAPFFIYGENQRTSMAAMESLAPVVRQAEDPWGAESLMQEIDSALAGNQSVKAAIDMALYDLQGQLCGKPLHSLLGLRAEDTPQSTFTLYLDSPETLREKVRRVADWPLLKVKLGGQYDLEAIELVRKEAPDAVIRVDANAAWEPHQALDMIKELVRYQVEFVEQPLPAADPEGMRWLHSRSPLPLVADESCLRLEDLPGLRGLFDGINIKLTKCGGIRHALKMISCARALGLKIMLGCMVESSISLTAAGQISPLVDYADLDGNTLLEHDPFIGMQFDKCRLVLPAGPGLGVKSAE